MPHTLILHIQGEEPVIGEVEELPAGNAVLIAVNNPRRMDGKELQYLQENVLTVIWPLSKLNFIEIVSEDYEEEIIGFVRE